MVNFAESSPATRVSSGSIAGATSTFNCGIHICWLGQSESPRQLKGRRVRRPLIAQKAAPCKWLLWRMWNAHKHYNQCWSCPTRNLHTLFRLIPLRLSFFVSVSFAVWLHPSRRSTAKPSDGKMPSSRRALTVCCNGDTFQWTPRTLCCRDSSFHTWTYLLDFTCLLTLGAGSDIQKTLTTIKKPLLEGSSSYLDKLLTSGHHALRVGQAKEGV